MIRNYQLNEENRIVATQEFPFLENEPSFDFPDTFEFGEQIDWKIINDELVHDPIPPEPEPEPMVFTEQERSEFLEGLMIGVGL